MARTAFRRIPAHVGIIPDGNRRWAEARGLAKEAGYAHGVAPGLELFDACRELGIGELSIYGFTQDNAKRASAQRVAFQEACVAIAGGLADRQADLRVIGDAESPMFPEPLRPFVDAGRPPGAATRVNLLVNYSWQWDLAGLAGRRSTPGAPGALGSSGVSRIDLVIRWGGRQRLSGFLPIQCVYADFFFLDSLWPDFDREDLSAALHWYQSQDVTLGG